MEAPVFKLCKEAKLSRDSNHFAAIDGTTKQVVVFTLAGKCAWLILLGEMRPVNVCWLPTGDLAVHGIHNGRWSVVMYKLMDGGQYKVLREFCTLIEVCKYQEYWPETLSCCSEMFVAGDILFVCGNNEIQAFV